MVKKLKTYSNVIDNQEKIDFDLNECPEESCIEFCGTGTSGSQGAIIDSVKLFSFNRRATSKFIRY